MDEGLLKTLEELALTYDLEPSLRDVIVEGSLDRALIGHYLEQRGITNAIVYNLGERIAMSKDSLIGLDETTGVRGYVVAAAKYMAIELKGGSASCATFVVDRDWEWLSAGDDATEDPPNLLKTDFASIEMYAWNEQAIEKLLRLGLGSPRRVKAQAVMAAVGPLLVAVFIARWVLHESNMGVALPDKIEKHCNFDKRAVSTRDLLRSAGGPAVQAAERLAKQVDDLMASAPEDVRLAIRGHDAVRLMFVHLKTYIPAEIRNEKAFGRMWMLSVDVQALQNFPTFKSLEERIAA